MMHAVIILFCIIADLWLISSCLKILPSLNEMRWLTKQIFVNAAIRAINFVYAYLTIDAFVSVSTILSLYSLTYKASDTNFSPTAWFVRWGGIALLLLFYTLQFPIIPVGRLLNPIIRKFASISSIRDSRNNTNLIQRILTWFIGLGGVPQAKCLNDLFQPWIIGINETIDWIGYKIICGAVGPYLGILAISSILQLLVKIFVLDSSAQRVLTLLALLSDYGGVLVVLSLMINLVFLSFRKPLSDTDNDDWGDNDG